MVNLIQLGPVHLPMSIFFTHQIDTGIIFDMAQINLDRVNLVCKKIDTGIILYLNLAEINSRSSIWCVKKLTRLNFNCSRVKKYTRVNLVCKKI